ncbi:hypothetical protein Indivirus_1_35 [Indivirus ILV1]|uniref:Uncharacterized protein n=1 Tax=Indivirus ILV1 TaxID=1977633 RepID=A0A1V0SCH4_9VIRU|nr:hypothetical protein Indivirus_1_35 [Indivirus ILV1]
MDEVNLDELDDFTPEAIADALFHQEPKDALSCRLVANPDEVDSIYLFELLVTILMEGMDIIVGDLSKIDLSGLSIEHITSLNPWFHSLGFLVRVDLLDKNDDTTDYDEYYCKIILKTKLHEIIFEHNGIDKNYHFFINGSYLEDNEEKENLKELYAVFINNDDVFKISFDFYLPPTIHVKLL